MTPIEFYDRLQSIIGPGVVTLSPGPLTVNVGTADAIAARLLLWLHDEMPEDATVGDLFDVLDAAHWWATFWTSRSTVASQEHVDSGGSAE